jgi:hypothetical protein
LEKSNITRMATANTTRRCGSAAGRVGSASRGLRAGRAGGRWRAYQPPTWINTMRAISARPENHTMLR